MSSFVNLSAKQQKAVLLSVQGMSQRDIAQELEVTPETVSRWQNRPDFSAAKNSLLEEARASTASKLRTLAEKAVETLEQLLEAKDTSDSVKLSTARLVVQFTYPHGLPPIGATSEEAIRAEQELKSLWAKLG